MSTNSHSESDGESNSSWILLDNERNDEIKAKEIPTKTTVEDENLTRDPVEEVEEEHNVGPDSDGVRVISEEHSSHSSDETTAKESKQDEKTDVIPCGQRDVVPADDRSFVSKSALISAFFMIAGLLLALYFKSDDDSDFSVSDDFNYKPDDSIVHIVTNPDYNRISKRHIDSKMQQQMAYSQDREEYSKYNEKYKKNKVDTRKKNEYEQKNEMKKGKKEDYNIKKNEKKKYEKFEKYEKNWNDHKKEHKVKKYEKYDQRKHEEKFEKKRKGKKNKKYEDDSDNDDDSKEERKHNKKSKKYNKHSNDSDDNDDNDNDYHKKNKNNGKKYKDEYKNKNKTAPAGSGEWFQNMHNDRHKIRRQEESSDWYFDRSRMRKKARDKSVHFDFDDRQNTKFKKL